jgi:hypothetical protein
MKDMVYEGIKILSNAKYLRLVSNSMVKTLLTLKISSNQISVAGYFGQPLTYPDFIIFSFDFLCNSLKS